MRSMIWAWSIALIAGLAMGCGGDDDGMTTGPAMTRFYVVSYLDIGKQTMTGIAPGFNLDGMTSTMDDMGGCFQADYTSPAPDNTPGVDNQLASDFGNALNMIAGGDISGTIAAGLADGTILLLMEVTDINDFTNDSSVGISFYLGVATGTVMTSGGRISPGQTFNVDSRSFAMGSMTPLITFTGGKITSGELTAGPSDFMLNLPIGDVAIALTIQTAQISFDITQDGGLTHGVLGGKLNVAATARTVAALGFADEMTVRGILANFADLDNTDGTGTMCEAISVALVFEGAAATKGMVVMPGTPGTDAGTAGGGDGG